MRRPYSTLAAILLVLTACSRSDVDIAAEKAAIQTRSDAMVAAEAAKDIDTALLFWTDDGTVLLPTGAKIEGKPAIREFLIGMFATFDTFEGTTTAIKVDSSGAVAYEYGTNRIVYPGDVVETGKYVIVWRKIDDVWLMAAVSMEDDKPSSTPL
ncbi:MAG: DUF4440 domain-containing protein [Pseudomonadota bacterium]